MTEMVYFKELVMLKEIELKATERLTRAYILAAKAQEEISDSLIDISAIKKRVEECEIKLVEASQEANYER